MQRTAMMWLNPKQSVCKKDIVFLHHARCRAWPRTRHRLLQRVIGPWTPRTSQGGPRSAPLVDIAGRAGDHLPTRECGAAGIALPSWSWSTAEPVCVRTARRPTQGFSGIWSIHAAGDARFAASRWPHDSRSRHDGSVPLAWPWCDVGSSYVSASTPTVQRRPLTHSVQARPRLSRKGARSARVATPPMTHSSASARGDRFGLRSRLQRPRRLT